MSNLAEILENFKNQKIAVIGDIILDKYIFGEVDRISPEAPVPVVKVREEKYVPGGAANVACNLVSLGAEAFLLGLTGEDEDRDILLGAAEIREIDTSGIVTDRNRKTIKKTRVIGMNQQLLRIDFEDDHYIESQLEKAIMANLSAISSLNAVIISDYAKGAITEQLLEQVKNWCKERSILLVVDPKPKHREWYREVDLITPNKLEAQLMTGIHIDDEADYQAAVRSVSEKLQASVVLTAGAGGMYVLENEDSSLENGDRRQGSEDRRVGPEDRRKQAEDRRQEAEVWSSEKEDRRRGVKDRRIGPDDRRRKVEVKHIPTVAREVYDVSGAGDTVAAALTLARVSGADLNTAAEIANHAAGIKVSKLGTATVSWEELRQGLLDE